MQPIKLFVSPIQSNPIYTLTESGIPGAAAISFDTTEDDLRRALIKYFRYVVKVESITIRLAPRPDTSVKEIRSFGKRVAAIYKKMIAKGVFPKQVPSIFKVHPAQPSLPEESKTLLSENVSGVHIYSDISDGHLKQFLLNFEVKQENQMTESADGGVSLGIYGINIHPVLESTQREKGSASCTNKGTGWTLPTPEDLALAWSFVELIPGFEKDPRTYWDLPPGDVIGRVHGVNGFSFLAARPDSSENPWPVILRSDRRGGHWANWEEPGATHRVLCVKK